jgi:hypothetical protein
VDDNKKLKGNYAGNSRPAPTLAAALRQHATVDLAMGGRGIQTPLSILY